MSAAAVVEAGSFRDPGGRVFSAGEKILRTVTDSAVDSFTSASQSGVLRRLADAGKLVDFADVTDQAPALGLADAREIGRAHV